MTVHRSSKMLFFYLDAFVGLHFRSCSQGRQSHHHHQRTITFVTHWHCLRFCHWRWKLQLKKWISRTFRMWKFYRHWQNCVFDHIRLQFKRSIRSKYMITIIKFRSLPIRIQTNRIDMKTNIISRWIYIYI